MGYSGKKYYILFILILCFLRAFSVDAATPYKQLSFALFAPRADSFWPLQESFMIAACKDLNIQCNVYYADDNQFKMLRQIESVTSGSHPVDAVLFHNYKQQGIGFIQLAEKNKVASFLINTPLSEKTYKVTGKPREKYKYWLGEMIPDDALSGYIITNSITDSAIKAGKVKSGGKVRMFAINGIVSDGATIEREKGLRKAISERDDILFYQYITSDWSKEKAIQKYRSAIQRYPDVNVIWTGADDLAFGITQEAGMHGLKAGEDFFIAGIGWSEAGIDAVKNGTFTVNVGGHFLEGAWAVIMLYDYFQGIDFKEEGLQFKSSMYPIYKSNAEDVSTLFSALEENKIDFSLFSKYHSPEVKEYNFSIKAILQRLNN